MESRYIEVKPFFESKYGKFKSTMSANSIGWGKEKQAMLQQQADEELEDFKKNRKREIKETLNQLLHVVRRKISLARTTGQLSGDEIKKFWEIFKTEAGEPTKITKTDITMTGFDFEKARDNLDHDASTPTSDIGKGKSAGNLQRPTKAEKPTA